MRKRLTVRHLSVSTCPMAIIPSYERRFLPNWMMRTYGMHSQA